MKKLMIFILGLGICFTSCQDNFRRCKKCDVSITCVLGHDTIVFKDTTYGIPMIFYGFDGNGNTILLYKSFINGEFYKEKEFINIKGKHPISVVKQTITYGDEEYNWSRWNGKIQRIKDISNLND